MLYELADSAAFAMQNVQALVTNPAIQPWNKLRLVILYALRYQKTQAQNVASLINLMLENGVSREDARVRMLIGLPNLTSLMWPFSLSMFS